MRIARDHGGLERGGYQTPFRRRVCVRQAAAERAAHADRVMRDVTRDLAQQFAERIVDHRFMKGSMTNTSADRQYLSIGHDLVETGDLIDVDEMRGLCQPERHDRHQTLSTRQHAAVLRRVDGEKSQRLVERFRCVANEWRWLHATDRRQLNICARTLGRGSQLSNSPALCAVNVFVRCPANGGKSMCRKIVLSLAVIDSCASAAV